MTDQERKAMEMALEALEEIHAGNMTPMAEENWNKALTALRQALAQPEQSHPDHFAEVYIRVGDLHVKKILTQIEFLQAYDPIKFLSLVADDCIQTLKDLL